MKKIHILLLIVFALRTSFCFGQILFTENGLSLRYEGNEKINNRYDEYCKTFFDIYRVKGTVINSNGDKAAHVTAILNFYGHICNKIYSNAGPSGGEIIDKVYSLNIPLQTTQKAKYWVNRFVTLLPEDEITAYGYVEVKQGEPCPEPNRYFTYELVDSKGNVPDSKSEETITENTPVKTTAAITTTNNYASLIVGNWQETHRVSYTNGNTEEENVRESSKCGVSVLKFEHNGAATEWNDCYDDGSITYDSWSVLDKQLIYNIGSMQLKVNIYQFDNAVLVLKTVIDDNNYVINTYRKFE